MDKDEMKKEREEREIARAIKDDSEQPLLLLVNQYMEGWKDTDDELTKKAYGSFFDVWFCCQSLGDYLDFLKHPVERLVKGFVKKEDHIEEHLWIQMGDSERNIIDPFASFINDPDLKMPEVYIGKKPKWYEEVDDE